MKVSNLISILQRNCPDSDVYIEESESEFKQVLVVKEERKPALYVDGVCRASPDYEFFEIQL